MEPKIGSGSSSSVLSGGSAGSVPNAFGFRFPVRSLGFLKDESMAPEPLVIRNPGYPRKFLVMVFFGTLFCHQWGAHWVSGAENFFVRIRKMWSTIWEWSQSLWSSRNKENIGNTSKILQTYFKKWNFFFWKKYVFLKKYVPFCEVLLTYFLYFPYFLSSGGSGTTPKL